MELPDFSGPFGGVVAGSFLSGCAAGYAFAKRTVLKLAHSECEALTTRIDEIKAEQIARGVAIIDLTIGDPDLPTPEHIFKKMHEFQYIIKILRRLIKAV